MKWIRHAFALLVAPIVVATGLFVTALFSPDDWGGLGMVYLALELLPRGLAATLLIGLPGLVLLDRIKPASRILPAMAISSAIGVTATVTAWSQFVPLPSFLLSWGIPLGLIGALVYFGVDRGLERLFRHSRGRGESSTTPFRKSPAERPISGSRLDRDGT